MKAVAVIYLFIAFLMIGMLMSCKQKLDQSPVPTPAPIESIAQLEPIAWEASNKEAVKWSQFVMQEVKKDFDTFEKAQDITLFCPKYKQLSKDQKLNAWAQFFAAVSYYESGWSPVSRMIETTMGKDCITGKQIVSEGLLQLSYCDMTWAKACQFDWSADKDLADKDPKKTILDPYKNLSCGISIMAGQLNKHGKLVLKSSLYWAVLKDESVGKYSKVTSISKMVQKLSICK